MRERRRKWSAEEKAEIVAVSLAEGAVVSDVARRHGLSPQQLFGWRARLRDAVTAAGKADAGGHGGSVSTMAGTNAGVASDDPAMIGSQPLGTT